jgi:hypothetical protein
MPAFTIPSFEGSIHPTAAAASSHIPPPSNSTAKPSHPVPPRHRSKKAPEPSHDIDSEILKAFCSAKPGSPEAADLIQDIVEGHSNFFKIPRKRQIALLYKAFQHHWLQSLCEVQSIT